VLKHRPLWILALAAAGLAGAVNLLYAQWGPILIEDAYHQRLPVEWLNRIIKRQEIHSLDYYLALGQRATRHGLLLSVAWVAALIGLERARRRWPRTPFLQTPWSAALGTGLLFAAINILQIPLLQLLPYWFWAQRPKDLPHLWLALPMAAAVYYVGRTVLDNPQRHARNLGIVILLGFVLQQGFAWMQEDGTASLKSRLLDSIGHRHLAYQAVEQDPRQLAGHYEDLLNSGELAAFPHATRPPGQLVVLGWIARLAGSSAEALAAWGSWLFPLCTYLVIIPLFFLCRLYGGDDYAWAVALLYALLPNAALMTMHLDQWLFPLLGWSAVALWAYAVERQDTAAAALALAAGAVFYLALFTTFALVALGPLLAILTWRRRAWRQAAWAAAGFALVYTAFLEGLDYDAWTRYTQAMAAHQEFKIAAWGIGATLYFAVLNLLEFSVWCGIPLAVLAAYGLRHNLRLENLRQWQKNHQTALNFGLVTILLGLVLLGRTAGEVGRLWLFLAPLVLMAAASHAVHTRYGVRVLLLAQFFSAVVLRQFQDF
jgi:hypothetical protein